MNDTPSVLFVVLGETEQDLELAQGIIRNTEICTTSYMQICQESYTAAESFLLAALDNQSLRMVVIAVPESGNLLKNALELSKLAKEKGLLTIVETQCCGQKLGEYLVAESLTMEHLTSFADCILVTPTRHDNVASKVKMRKRFCRDVQNFQRYLITMLDGNDFVYLDFEDISAVLKESGLAYFDVANIKGADTQERKARMASMDLFSGGVLAKAAGVIMHIVGSEDIDLEDVEAVANLVQPHIHSDSALIFGAGFDSELCQEIQVSVLVAGIDD